MNPASKPPTSNFEVAFKPPTNIREEIDPSNKPPLTTVEATTLKRPFNNDAPLSGKAKLLSWLNRSMKVDMSDGRVLIGSFLCTDRDANLILGSCTEYLNPQVCGFSDEPRILGLVMVPGRHIVSIHLDKTQANGEDQRQKKTQDVV